MHYYIGVHLEDRSCIGNHKEIGFWQNYFVYEIEDHVISRLDLAQRRVVVFPSKDVAMGWLFANPNRDAITVRPANNEYVLDYLGRENLVPKTLEKYKYFITPTDADNGLLFAKLVLREKVNRDYETMWSYIKSYGHSPLLSEYLFRARLAGGGSSFLSDLDPALLALDDEYFHCLKVLGKELLDEHRKIDALSCANDVNKYLAYMHDRINDLPKAIISDRRTNNVQRAAQPEA